MHMSGVFNWVVKRRGRLFETSNQFMCNPKFVFRCNSMSLCDMGNWNNNECRLLEKNQESVKISVVQGCLGSEALIVMLETCIKSIVNNLGVKKSQN